MRVDPGCPHVINVNLFDRMMRCQFIYRLNGLSEDFVRSLIRCCLVNCRHKFRMRMVHGVQQSFERNENLLCERFDLCFVRNDRALSNVCGTVEVFDSHSQLIVKRSHIQLEFIDNILVGEAALNHKPLALSSCRSSVTRFWLEPWALFYFFVWRKLVEHVGEHFSNR